MADVVVGLLSDTHLSSLDGGLLAALKTHLGDAKLLIHAGDVTSPLLLDELQAHGWEVVAVRGNMDPDLGPDVPQVRWLELGGLRLGVAHGWGPPTGIRRRVLELFERKPDVLIYGHTHVPDDSTLDGVRFLNPGSPTDRRFAPFRSLGRLEISETARGPQAAFRVIRLD